MTPEIKALWQKAEENLKRAEAVQREWPDIRHLDPRAYQAMRRLHTALGALIREGEEGKCFPE